MKKLRVSRGIILTFEEGCNRYLENCRQRRYISSAKRIYADHPQKKQTHRPIKSETVCLLSSNGEIQTDDRTSRGFIPVTLEKAR